MSKTQETRETSRPGQENISPIKDHADKFFSDVTKSITQYIQSLEDLQQECAQSCKKMFDLAISSQQEFANQFGVAPTTEITQKAINDSLESGRKAYATNCEGVVSVMNMARNNINSLNVNAKSLADLNRNVIQSWFSLWLSKRG